MPYIDQPRSARALFDDEPLVDVSVDELFIVDDEEDDVSLLAVPPVEPLLVPVPVVPVPLAPMLDVLLLLSESAVVLEVLGLLGVVELLLEEELLGVVVLAPIEPCVLLAS